MLILVVLMALMPVTLPAATESEEGCATNPIGAAVSAYDGAIPQDDAVLKGGSTAPTAVPRGPEDLLHDYEAEMAAIAQKFLQLSLRSLRQCNAAN